MSSGGDIDRAFSLIQQSQHGLVPDDFEWIVLRISPPEYLELYWQLQRKPRLLYHFEHELRSDYSPDYGTLILRLLASALHENFQENIQDYIWSHIKSIRRSGDSMLSRLASNIRSMSHTKVKLASGGCSEKVEARKSPDCQLVYFSRPSRGDDNLISSSKRYSPQFVVEVAYGQKARALWRLAQEYYEKSDTKTVLTFKLGYLSPAQRKSAGDGDRSRIDHTASFSLYRGPECIFRDTVFRDSSGNATTASFQFYLSDFIPDQVLDKLSLSIQGQVKDTEIEMTAQMLKEILDEAEDVQNGWDATSTPPPVEPTEPAEPGQDNNTLLSRKRVHWQVDSGSDDDHHDDTEYGRGSEDDPGDEDFDDRRSDARSKRRRRELPERGRTRSWTREHEDATGDNENA